MEEHSQSGRPKGQKPERNYERELAKICKSYNKEVVVKETDNIVKNTVEQEYIIFEKDAIIQENTITIENLRRNVLEIQGNYERLDQKYQRECSNRTSLVERIEKTTSLVEEAREFSQVLSASVKQCDEDKYTLAKYYQRISEGQEQAEQRAKALEKVIQDQERQIEQSIINVIAARDRDIAEATKTVSCLKQKLTSAAELNKQLTLKMSEANANVQKSESVTNNLERELKALEADKAAVSKHAEQLKVKIESLTQQITTVAEANKERTETLEIEIDMLKKKLNDSETEIVAFVQQVQNLQFEQSSLKKERDGWIQERLQLEAAQQEANSKLQSVIEEMNLLIKQLNEEVLRRESLSQEMEAVEKNAADVQAKLNSEVEMLIAERDSLGGSVKDLCEQVNEWQRKYNQERQTGVGLETELSVAREANKSLEVELKQLTVGQRDLEEQIKVLEAELKELQHNTEVMQKTHEREVFALQTDSQKKMIELDQQLSVTKGYREQMDEWQRKYNQERQTSVGLETELSVAREANKSLELILNQVNVGRSDLEEQNKVLEAELKELQHNTEVMQKTHETEVFALQADSQKKIIELEQQLSVTKGYREQMDEWQRKYNQERQTSVGLETELSVAREANKSLEVELNQVNVGRSDLEEQNKVLEAKLMELQHNTEVMEKTHETEVFALQADSQKKIIELEQQLSDTKALLGELKTVEEQNQKQAKKLVEMHQREEQNDAVCRSIKIGVQRVTEENEELSKEIQQLKTVLNNANQTKTYLQDQINTQKDAHAEEMRSKNEEIEKLKAMLNKPTPTNNQASAVPPSQPRWPSSQPANSQLPKRMVSRSIDLTPSRSHSNSKTEGGGSDSDSSMEIVNPAWLNKMPRLNTQRSAFLKNKERGKKTSNT